MTRSDQVDCRVCGGRFYAAEHPKGCPDCAVRVIVDLAERRARMDERRVRSVLYPRPRLVDVSPRTPPVPPSAA